MPQKEEMNDIAKAKRRITDKQKIDEKINSTRYQTKVDPIKVSPKNAVSRYSSAPVPEISKKQRKRHLYPQREERNEGSEKSGWGAIFKFS